MATVNSKVFENCSTIKGDDIYEKVLDNALGRISNGRKTTLHDWQKIRITSINMYESKTINYDKGGHMVLSEKYHHHSQNDSQN